jgi:ferredoxin-thioredoxin reductase catalytic subunit
LITLDQVRQRAESDAKFGGYGLNPDPAFLKDLLEGLKTNEERYGYPSCPCRIAAGKFDVDRDIICPCDYRDPDVQEFGACYCALFVRRDVYEGKTPLQPVPERRPPEKRARAIAVATGAVEIKPKTVQVVAEKPEELETKSKMKLWYCKQCGYVVFREEPPYMCPICKAKREMFAEIKLRTIMV